MTKQEFMTYFMAHYPEGSVIHNPGWHAARLYRAMGSSPAMVYPADAAPVAAQEPMTRAQIMEWMRDCSGFPVVEQNAIYLERFASEISRRASQPAQDMSTPSTGTPDMSTKAQNVNMSQPAQGRRISDLEIECTTLRHGLRLANERIADLTEQPAQGEPTPPEFTRLNPMDFPR